MVIMFLFLTSVMNWDNVIGYYPIFPLESKEEYYNRIIKYINLVYFLAFFFLPYKTNSFPRTQSLKPEERNRETSMKS